MRMTSRRLRERTSGVAMVIQSAIRRMTVSATSMVLWALEGFEDIDGNLETDEVETFPGVGFYARPKSGDETEVIVLKVGGESGHPVIVATRNHDGIKRIGSLGEDETIVFNSKSVVKITAAGEIHVGTIGGLVAPLATKADLDAHIAIFNSHMHASSSPGGPTSPPATVGPPTAPGPPPVFPPPVPSLAGSSIGTLKLKAQ